MLYVGNAGARPEMGMGVWRELWRGQAPTEDGARETFGPTWPNMLGWRVYIETGSDRPRKPQPLDAGLCVDAVWDERISPKTRVCEIQELVYTHLYIFTHMYTYI